MIVTQRPSYTCFISFNDADDTFSERLYDDLQAKGVRCWRWKEDAPWGKTLMRSVDEAIRLYDKLIVICSEHSLKAEPVVREIERALQKEQRENKEVLFPIRVDDAVFSWKHELQADVARKYIGDFTHWHEPKAYTKALERLIRDLRTVTIPSPA
ncbi:MAG: toll/interleukin-1 receptor domain-containing protein [Candidatus Zixiibacteriota bacterium]